MSTSKEDMEVIRESVERIGVTLCKFEDGESVVRAMRIVSAHIALLADSIESTIFFNESMPERNMVVEGDYCDFTIDHQGYVANKSIRLGCCDGTHAHSITRFDLVEWKKHWGKDDLPDSFDMIDLGYWYGSKNDYEPPCREIEVKS